MAPVCPLCYGIFTLKHPLKVPRKLHCGHTFCTECTLKLEDIQGVVLECPFCHNTTLLSAGGIGELERDMAIIGLNNKNKQPESCQLCIRKTYPPRTASLYCSDCEVSLCGTCSDATHLKQENTMHTVYLASAQDETNKPRIHDNESSTSYSRSLNMRSGMRSRPTSSGSNFNDSRSPSNLLLVPDQIPECPEHGEKMQIYCRTDRCLCCSFCEAIGIHKGHDCFQVHEAEEKERNSLIKLQNKVELHSDRFIRARNNVQRMIEEVKKNSISIKDVVRRYFREMRAAIDDSEKMLVQELVDRSDTNLNALREQLSKMINISGKAKTASRNCDDALSYDYYEMLAKRKDVEEEMLCVLDMMVATQPVAKANLYCQFPNHESLLNLIRTCSYIVEGPPAPSDFSCSLSEEGDVILSWSEPESMRYIYPVLHYLIQASIGAGNTFINICKTKMTNYRINKDSESLPCAAFVQFQVIAENIIDKSPPSRQMGIKIPALVDT